VLLIFSTGTPILSRTYAFYLNFGILAHSMKSYTRHVATLGVINWISVSSWTMSLKFSLVLNCFQRERERERVGEVSN